MAGSSPDVSDPEDHGGDASVHPADLRTLHRGDLTRVTTDELVLDPGAVIAVWPYYQADFDGSHPEDMSAGETKYRGTRVTIATEDGGRFAAVDWNNTEDPPLLYLLVIDSEDPEQRRWDRVGSVRGLERYGEPEDRTPEWWGRPASHDIVPWVVEREADPEFTAPGGDADV